eukprot:TRINITY_DN5743_c0_g2_i1.p1 TRINITY_DN5743_c0_g2~~TRINITY_DN5743_c0_g2_i1.p1  ORF type:complete len:441 (+),score=165.92 TRINITY_DN5743_c0_g2_i1:60-1325(+)
MSRRLDKFREHLKETIPSLGSPQVAICGGGNAAHLMLVDIGSRGYPVDMYLPFRDEAEKFKAGMAQNGGRVTMHAQLTGRTFEVAPRRVSRDPRDVIPGAKYIFIPLPVFAHKPTLEQILPHCDEDAVVIAMPATGCVDWTAREVMKRMGKRVTVVGISPLPYVVRTRKYGQVVECFGIKPNVGVATDPPSAVQDLKPKLELMMGLNIVAYPTFLGCTLTPTNPIIHTARCYGMFGPVAEGGCWRKRGGYPRMIGFYDECDDVSGDWLQRLSDENEAIQKKLDQVIPGSIGPAQRSLCEFHHWASPDDVEKWDTCKNVCRTNKMLAGVGSPMHEVAPGCWVPDFKNRYFTEDFAFGLLANRGIAELVGQPTPYMDEVIEWAQAEMGKRWLVDGKVNPAEQPQMTPQAFGISLQDFVAMYTL